MFNQTYAKMGAAFIQEYNLDCQVIPLKYKFPFAHWLSGLLNNPTPGIANSSYWSLATGFGVAPIPGSCIAILDIDNIEHPLCRYIQWEYDLDRGLCVGHGDHRHYYLELPQPFEGLISITRDRVLAHAGYEIPDGSDYSCDGDEEILSLRGIGAYVVGPGSDHKDGTEYKVLGPMRRPVKFTPRMSYELMRLLRLYTSKNGDHHESL